MIKPNSHNDYADALRYAGDAILAQQEEERLLAAMTVFERASYRFSKYIDLEYRRELVRRMNAYSRYRNR